MWTASICTDRQTDIIIIVQCGKGTPHSHVDSLHLHRQTDRHNYYSAVWSGVHRIAMWTASIYTDRQTDIIIIVQCGKGYTA